MKLLSIGFCSVELLPVFWGRLGRMRGLTASPEGLQHRVGADGTAAHVRWCLQVFYQLLQKVRCSGVSRKVTP